jgi:hypothetical protein
MVEPTAPSDDYDDDLIETDEDTDTEAARDRPDDEDVTGGGQEPPD